MGKIIGWVVGLTALFMVLYYYVGSTSVMNGVFSGAGTIISQVTGRDANGNLPTTYPK